MSDKREKRNKSPAASPKIITNAEYFKFCGIFARNEYKQRDVVENLIVEIEFVPKANVSGRIKYTFYFNSRALCARRRRAINDINVCGYYIIGHQVKVNKLASGG